MAYFKNYKNIGLFILQNSISFLFIIFSKYCYFNKILGSSLNFSFLSIVTPAAAVNFGFVSLLIYIITVFKVEFSLFIFLRQLPLFFSSLSFLRINFICNIILPICCMLLFFMHSNGAAAFYYTFYWFIPIGCFFGNKNSLLKRALSSVFVAHACGSVLYLYYFDISSEIFTNLMAIVCIERALMLIGLLSFNFVFYKIAAFCKKSSFVKSLTLTA